MQPYATAMKHAKGALQTSYLIATIPIIIAGFYF